jgi:hypothetical protein
MTPTAARKRNGRQRGGRLRRLLIGPASPYAMARYERWQNLRESDRITSDLVASRWFDVALMPNGPAAAPATEGADASGAGLSDESAPDTEAVPA